MVRGILYYSTLSGHSAQCAALRKHFPAASAESLAGIALALACIDALQADVPGAMPANIAALEFPPRGKPRYLRGPQFSISHSAPVVACAAVSHGDVGLDVECDEAADHLALSTICDDAERALARTIGTRRVWMAKEAALKAGGGTIEQIAAVRLFTGGASFRTASFHECRVELDGRWPACIMTSAPGVRFDVRRIDLDAEVWAA